MSSQADTWSLAGTPLPDSAPGAALLAGFLVMLLLDQLQGHPHSHGSAHPSSSDEDLETGPLSHGHDRKASVPALQQVFPVQILSHVSCQAQAKGMTCCSSRRSWTRPRVSSLGC